MRPLSLISHGAHHREPCHVVCVKRPFFLSFFVQSVSTTYTIAIWRRDVFLLPIPTRLLAATSLTENEQRSEYLSKRQCRDLWYVPLMGAGVTRVMKPCS